MAKDSTDIIKRLASLYGLKYSEQRAKGKKVFVMVALPSQSQLQLSTS